MCVIFLAIFYVLKELVITDLGRGVARPKKEG